MTETRTAFRVVSNVMDGLAHCRALGYPVKVVPKSAPGGSPKARKARTEDDARVAIRTALSESSVEKVGLTWGPEAEPTAGELAAELDGLLRGRRVRIRYIIPGKPSRETFCLGVDYDAGFDCQLVRFVNAEQMRITSAKPGAASVEANMVQDDESVNIEVIQ
jgi:hypothetical protein